MNETNDWNKRTNEQTNVWMNGLQMTQSQAVQQAFNWFWLLLWFEGGTLLHPQRRIHKMNQQLKRFIGICLFYLEVICHELFWQTLFVSFGCLKPRAGIQQCRNRSILCQSLGFHFLLRCPKLFEHLLTAGSFKGFPSHSAVCPWICCVLRKIKHFMKDGSAPGTRWIFHSKKLFYYIHQSLSNLLVFAEDTHDELCFKLWSNAVFLCILQPCVIFYILV